MKTCLVVDDSRIVRKIVRDMVQGLGYHVEEAEDGVEAVSACEQSMPDLIFLDWNMPRMSGIDFLKTLRSMEDGTAPKVLFCTTEAETVRIEEALVAGCDEYIIKPFDRAIIESKLALVGLG